MIGLSPEDEVSYQFVKSMLQDSAFVSVTFSSDTPYVKTEDEIQSISLRIVFGYA